MNVDPAEMHAFQYREENGSLPDEHYAPTEEDDPHDPEQQEIRAMVIERYAATNESRRAERAQARIGALVSLLEANGIDVPEDY
jgi:hypothetical protein